MSTAESSTTGSTAASPLFPRAAWDRSLLPELGIIVGIMGVLFLVMQQNFLLFHFFAELFAIVVSTTIFMIAWNTRETNQSPFLAFIGLSLPAVALLVADLLDLPPLEARMLLLFAALPTASAAYVLAMRMGGDGRMVAVLISLGTLFSALTIPAWLLLAD